MVGDDELGKTRGQTQQQAEESAEAKTPEKPKLPRDSTMVVTAKVKFISAYYIIKELLLQEGAQIVGDQELEKTRAQTGEKNVTTSPISPKVKRQTTVGATVEVRSCVLMHYLNTS